MPLRGSTLSPTSPLQSHLNPSPRQGGGGAGGEGGGEGLKKADIVPFKPSNAFASKRQSHIEYIHDPEGPKIAAERARKAEEHKKLAASGPWKPNLAATKTDMVRSVVRMNIPRG